jgi:ferric-dicitrate binding protein FerR (iron transport regulator)
MGEEEIGNLIRSADRRPPIPAEELTNLKQVARSAWDELVTTERTRRRRLRVAQSLAASLLLALLGAWWWLAGRGPIESAEIASVDLSTGWVEAVRGSGPETGESFEIGVGDNLSNGLTVATAGTEHASPGRVALRMARGQSVRLDAGTRIRFLSHSRLELERGAVYVDSGPSVSDDADLEILTPLGLVREIGTQYEVRLEDETDTVRVRVREGSVSVVRDGESHSAGRGEQLTLQRDGSVARSVVEPDGPEWLWVLATAPSLNIDGQSLGTYLDWVARETGWQVRYADEELEQSARTIRLHGTIDGLQPNESIGMILQGSGLDYRNEEGAILVVRP